MKSVIETIMSISEVKVTKIVGKVKPASGKLGDGVGERAVVFMGVGVRVGEGVTVGLKRGIDRVGVGIVVGVGVGRTFVSCGDGLVWFWASG